MDVGDKNNILVGQVITTDLNITLGEYVGVRDTGSDTAFVHHYLNGAITKNKISLIKRNIKTVVFEDFTKIFLSYGEWQSLSKKYHLYFKEKFELSSFIINLYNTSKEDFKKTLNSQEIIKKVIFNPYAE